MNKSIISGYTGIFNKIVDPTFTSLGASIYALGDADRGELDLILLTPDCYTDVARILTNSNIDKVRIILPSVSTLFLATLESIVTNFGEVIEDLKWVFPVAVGAASEGATDLQLLLTSYVNEEDGEIRIKFIASGSSNVYDLLVNDGYQTRYFCQYLTAAEMLAAFTDVSFDEIHIPYNSGISGSLTYLTALALNADYEEKLYPNTFLTVQDYYAATFDGLKPIPYTSATGEVEAFIPTTEKYLKIANIVRTQALLSYVAGCAPVAAVAATYAVDMANQSNRTIFITNNYDIAQVETATVPSPAQVETATIPAPAQVETLVIPTPAQVETATVPAPAQVETATITAPAQVETATVAGTITTTGDATVIITSANMANSPKTIAVAVVENDTAALVAGKIRTALGVDADVVAEFTVGGSDTAVILTSKTVETNDSTLNISIADGTCVGITTAATSANTTASSITTAGNASVIITSANMDNSPKTIPVAVALDDSFATVADKIRTALGLDADVSEIFTVSGASTAVILTAKVVGVNDATLNIAIADGTCVGITPVVTSTNTTASSIKTAGNATVTITSDIMNASPKPIAVAVALHDSPAAVAEKIRAALLLDEDVTEVFDVGGASTAIILTAKEVAINDATLNIAIADGTCVGLTSAPSSTNTTRSSIVTTGNATVTITSANMNASPKAISVPVVENDSFATVADKVRTALGLDADVSATFTISGTGAYVTLTAKAVVTNDSTLNIAIADGTCVGITAVPTSTNRTASSITTAGNASVIITSAIMDNSPKTIAVAVALDDSPATVAGKIRTALGLDADVSEVFTITGANENVILTAKEVALNDATLNISIADGTCVGLSPDTTSTNTTASSIVTSGDASVIVTSANMQNSPKTISVAVLEDDTFETVAANIREALADDEDVSEVFTVSGTGRNIILTAIVPAANDATLNIAIADDTCDGITTAGTSTNSTAGATSAKTTTITNVPTIAKLTINLSSITATTMTWFSGINWIGGTPSFSASRFHELQLVTVDGGTSWFGRVVGEWTIS